MPFSQVYGSKETRHCVYPTRVGCVIVKLNHEKVHKEFLSICLFVLRLASDHLAMLRNARLLHLPRETASITQVRSIRIKGAASFGKTRTHRSCIIDAVFSEQPPISFEMCMHSNKILVCGVHSSTSFWKPKDLIKRRNYETDQWSLGTISTGRPTFDNRLELTS